jgi:hypothetical protein
VLMSTFRSGQATLFAADATALPGVNPRGTACTWFCSILSLLEPLGQSADCHDVLYPCDVRHVSILIINVSILIIIMLPIKP